MSRGTIERRFPAIRAAVPWEQRRRAPDRFPLLLRALGVSAAVALMGGVTIGGFRASGWAWLLALVVAVPVLLRDAKRVSFPWLLWTPWVLMLGVRLATTQFPALQRTVQILVPLAVGLAVSTLRPEEVMLERLRRLARPALVVLALVFLVRARVIFTGTVPEATGFAAESMLLTLLASLYAAEWALGDARALRWWVAAVLGTLFTVTRISMASTVFTLPATLAPLRLVRRVGIVVFVGALSLAIFNTERVQRKTFASGEGGVGELASGEVLDSGRFRMWRLFRARIAERPWLGWGAGAGQAYARQITSGTLAYPHNEWLQNSMDYGYVGTGLFVLTMALAAVHALRAARGATGVARTFLYAGASGFPAFFVIMYGDNVMSYGAYFGDYQFAMLGLGYAALAGRRERREDAGERRA